MRYTYYGHSTFGVEIDGVHLLFDPFITPNGLAKHIDVDKIPCDYILITHGHGDHVMDAERIARHNDATIIASYEIASWFEAKGLKVHHMNTGGQWNFRGFKVKCTYAAHSSVLPDGTYGGNPMGYLVMANGKTLYYSGDTALTLDMQLIKTYHRPDRAFLCIGDNFTMGIDDAVVAADFVGCDQVTAMHFDTFPPIRIDHAEALRKFEKAGKKLTLPEIGKTYEL
jgi:L-ascorbate metabolism protein UlaG (beta-lactamase superfamily)